MSFCLFTIICLLWIKSKSCVTKTWSLMNSYFCVSKTSSLPRTFRLKKVETTYTWLLLTKIFIYNTWIGRMATKFFVSCKVWFNWKCSATDITRIFLTSGDFSSYCWRIYWTSCAFMVTFQIGRITKLFSASIAFFYTFQVTFKSLLIIWN